jgi:hypothetical protein
METRREAHFRRSDADVISENMMMITVTHFSDAGASRKREARYTEEDLAKLIRETTAPEKARLPWLKLATFGDVRTANGNSLRHNANVLTITGVEGDYDGGLMDDEVVEFERAVEIVKGGRLRAILYTSPSHADGHPRWRIVCPGSAALAPDRRDELMGRLNNLFGGAFSGESWTLSQSYYFGSVNGNRAHRVEVVEGDFIDERPDLGYRGKPNGVHRDAAGAAGDGRLDRGAALAAIASGDHQHEPLKKLAASFAGAGVTPADARRRLLDAFARVPEGKRDARWREHEKEIADLITWAYGKETEKASEEAVTLADFYAFMPTHGYIYTPTRAMWVAASINARIPPVALTKPNGEPVLDDEGKPVKMKASAWLDQHRPVEQMTWVPGEPMTIRDKLIVLEGGWVERRGATTFNLYHPPRIEPGDPAKAAPWVDHVRRVYPSDAEHIIDWLAHRVQKPRDKINHALLLGGEQGIGKDTLLEPVKYAVGPWNFQEASPSQVMGTFNGFLKSVVLRISEARDLGDATRFEFYDHMKTYTAAPPDVLRVNEKHLREHPVVNCCGVVITTNHKLDGIYLPEDDRRHYVAWSDLTKDHFEEGYWRALWAFYDTGGVEHVTAYLRERDVGFDPKAPPPKTEAFWAIVHASRPAEEGELADAIDRLGNPDVLSREQLCFAAQGDFFEWINDRKNRRAIPHRLEKAGYVPVRNPDNTRDGSWKCVGKSTALYAKKSLPLGEQITAARRWTKATEEKAKVELETYAADVNRFPGLKM